MGVDPITTTIGLGIAAVGAYALFLEQCRREEERRRIQEENSRRWRREARINERKKREEARIRERESEEEARIREMESEEEARREEARERRLWQIRRRQEEEEDDERRRRWTALSNDTIHYNYPMERRPEYYDSHQYYHRFEREHYFSSLDRYSPEDTSCTCRSCNPEQTQYRNESSCGCEPINFNIFENRKNSVSVTIRPPQTSQDKNQNDKNQGTRNKPSSINSQGATTSKSAGNASKQNTNSPPKDSNSGYQQPQRNNDANNNSHKDEKDKDQDDGKLNGFIKKLKAALDQCKASAELRKKMLSLFSKFEKHEENFLRLLEDFRIQNIAIEDILSIVVGLFQSDYFANDVAYENFIALMEIVAKYLKDELLSEIVKDSLKGSKTPFDKQRAECMKKVLQRKNILTDIIELFKKVQKEIVTDNMNQPLVPDFSGIFTKVYHYFKHKDVRGQEWTVTEYFDWIRKLLISLKGLDPEYVELSNVNHTRRQIVFEMYSTVFGGRFHIVVRAYGPRLNICTFFFKERYDKRAKDGDKYVDGKKKP